MEKTIKSVQYFTFFLNDIDTSGIMNTFDRSNKDCDACLIIYTDGTEVSGKISDADDRWCLSDKNRMGLSLMPENKRVPYEGEYVKLKKYAR